MTSALKEEPDQEGGMDHVCDGTVAHGNPPKMVPTRERIRITGKSPGKSPGTVFHFGIGVENQEARRTAVLWTGNPGHDEIRAVAFKTDEGWVVQTPRGEVDPADLARKTVEVVGAVDGTVEGSGELDPAALNLVGARTSSETGQAGLTGEEVGKIAEAAGINTRTIPKLDGMGRLPYPYSATRLVELGRVVVGGVIRNLWKSGIPVSDISWNPGWLDAWEDAAASVAVDGAGKIEGGRTVGRAGKAGRTGLEAEKAGKNVDRGGGIERTGLEFENAGDGQTRASDPAVVNFRKHVAAAVAERTGGAPPLAVYQADTEENRWALLRRTAEVGKTVRGDCEDLAILAVEAIRARHQDRGGNLGNLGPEIGIAVVVVDPTEEKTEMDVEEDREAAGAALGKFHYRNHMAVVAGDFGTGTRPGKIVLADGTAGVGAWKWAGVLVAIIRIRDGGGRARDPAVVWAVDRKQNRIGVTVGKSGIIERTDRISLESIEDWQNQSRK